MSITHNNKSPFRRKTHPLLALALVLWLPLLAFAAGCGEKAEEGAAGASGRGGGRPGGGQGMGGPNGAGGMGPATAVPVEVAPAERRSIASFLETNATLEAENEVDVVARISGPVTRLAVEEGKEVSRGQLLARIDDREAQARAEVSRVAHEEARLSFERAQRLVDGGLISSEEFEQTRSRLETTAAQLESDRLELAYTRVEAPFAGQIVVRYVDLAEQVNAGTPLFRLSDFNPLLAPIQVPERELQRLFVGQTANVMVESFPGERFAARVDRIRPVVDAATGTVRVTLEVEAEGKLRPGMFARVFLEVESRDDALVVPATALSLESLGDTLYVVEDGVARRRDVELGFRQGDAVEIISGLEEGEPVVVVGQQSLSDGTPVEVLERGSGAPRRDPASAAEPTKGQERPKGGGGAP